MTKKKKHKNLYLDTNILLNNPSVIYDFENSEIENICISDITLKELDEIKKKPGEKGRSARETIRELLKVVEEDNKINSKQRLCLVKSNFEDVTVAKFLSISTSSINNDDRIIAVLGLFETKKESTLFLTFDNVAYIKAKKVIEDNKYSFVDTELF